MNTHGNMLGYQARSIAAYIYALIYIRCVDAPLNPTHSLFIYATLLLVLAATDKIPVLLAARSRLYYYIISDSKLAYQK